MFLSHWNKVSLAYRSLLNADREETLAVMFLSQANMKDIRTNGVVDAMHKRLMRFSHGRDIHGMLLKQGMHGKWGMANARFKEEEQNYEVENGKVKNSQLLIRDEILSGKCVIKVTYTFKGH